MKKLYLIFLLFLNGCFYHDGCVYTPQMVNCFIDKGDIFPSVSRYQKPYSLGKTNSEQRWKDVVFCGGKSDDYKLENIKTVEQSDKLHHCMIEKDIFI